MIELVQSPDLNRVVADGNDTVVILQTREDPEYFIRVSIYIDDSPEVFLQQGWSKDENGLCVFNLKHLYYSYFENEFSAEYTTGFNKKDGLLKKVKIKAEEFKVGGDQPVTTLTLPDFYLIKNLKPVLFDDEQVLQFLGLPQQNIKVDRSTGFVFPLYLKAGNSLRVSVLNELNQEIYYEVLENYPVQVTQFELDFEDLDLSGLDFVYVKFATSAASVQKKLIFEDVSLYPPKTIFYLNNYGFYVSACLFGRKEDMNNLSPKTYVQNDGTEVTYDVEDVRDLELSSGYGYRSITDLIHAIATSLDVRMNIESVWEMVNTDTKKVTRLIDNQFVYGDALKFSRINLPSFTNQNTYAMVPKVDPISVSGDENQSIEIIKAAFLSVYEAIQPATVLQLKEVPVNGKVNVETETEVYSLSDLVANDPELLPYNISLADFVKLVYEPDQRQSGAPLDQIDFRMGTNVILSNTSQISYHVNDIPDSDLPPEIVLNTIKYIPLDTGNDGSAQMGASFNIADGHSLQVEWEVLNGAPISFDDNTAQDPTITLTDAVPDTTYQVKVTATDLTNGLFSEKTVNIVTSSFSVKVEKVNYPEAATTEQVDFHISGGQPGGAVRVKLSILMYMIVMGGSRYVLYNYGLPDEEIKYSGTEEIDLMLDENGELTIPCQITNENIAPVTVEMEVVYTAAPQIIDPNQFKATEEFSGQE